LVVALLALLVGGAVLTQTGSQAGSAVDGRGNAGKDGGIFRVSYSPQAPLTYVDPALAGGPGSGPISQPIVDATCARLYTHPDAASPRSYGLQPEVAASYSVSKDFKTWTFRLRSGFGFSNGEPVRASAFAHAIERVLHPAVQSPGAAFMGDIVGADDVLAGRSETVRGVVARGNTLVVEFTRPARNFLARTALPYFCAVPPWLPPSAEGLGVFPSAGPYSITEYRKGDRIEIRRNRFYGGRRRVHLDGFDVNLRGGNPVELLRGIERGDADWGWMLAGVYMTPGLDFEKKYGLGGRFRMLPGRALRMLAFNTSRPLFRNNLRLRQAVNLALDRRALVDSSYGPLAAPPTDQHLPPGVPGFRNADVYPLDGDLNRAKALARGHLRGGKAVLRLHGAPVKATAQLVKEQLAKIGLEIEIEINEAYELTRPAEAVHGEWDLGFVIWSPEIPDAHEYLKGFLDAHRHGGETLTRARTKLADAALARAALLPPGRARNRAHAEVDAMIARDLAPVAMLSVLNVATLVSERVDPGCMVLQPALDLAVACLRG
jgi:peptide/nickel transport system substrate-binding protein